MCTITSLSFNCSPIEKIKFPKLDKKVEGSEVFNIVGDWLSSVFNTINSGEILSSDTDSLLSTSKNISSISFQEKELSQDETEKINELINEFIEQRTSNLKYFATNLKIEKITNDLKSIKSFIESSKEDFLANVLNNVDLSLCMKAPIVSKNDTVETNEPVDEELPYSFEYND